MDAHYLLKNQSRWHPVARTIDATKHAREGVRALTVVQCELIKNRPFSEAVVLSQAGLSSYLERLDP